MEPKSVLLAHQTSLGAALSIIESRNIYRLSPPFGAEFLLIPPAEAITPKMRRSVASYYGEATGEAPIEELDIEVELALDGPDDAVRPYVHYDQLASTQAFPYEVEETRLQAGLLPALGGFRQISGFKNVGVILLFRWNGPEGIICTPARPNELKGDRDQIYHFFETGYWYSRIDSLQTNLLELVGCVVEDPDTPGFLQKLSKENGAATFENPYLHRGDVDRLLRTTRRILHVRGEAGEPYRGPTDTTGGRDVKSARRGRFPWSKPTTLAGLGRLHLLASAS
ncbi:hypothetical protein [Rhizobium leguminosarum]|uniref:hypothetical protein n=1 Tax=Rhizobium leguminosarum TaxID=384 RepID=UPI001CDB911B|nr:hypothetical protein [Rhizobium leguminosarum]